MDKNDCGMLEAVTTFSGILFTDTFHAVAYDLLLLHLSKQMSTYCLFSFAVDLNHSTLILPTSCYGSGRCCETFTSVVKRYYFIHKHNTQVCIAPVKVCS